MLRILVLAVASAALAASEAAAQPLGTFRWQLQPYCNVISVTVVQQGSQYLLDGTDTQCGDPRQASVRGIAFPNPDGSIGFGLSIVTSPGGRPVHVDATISLATLSGSWRDSTGTNGAFVFTPGMPAGGAPRPIPSVGVGDVTSVSAGTGLIGGGTAGDITLDVNPTAVQTRVTQVCAAGQAIRSIGQTGTVTCEALGGGGGDITGVAAGAGLTGGGVSGDVALAVGFGGPGVSAAAARSDHRHEIAGRGTAVGTAALAAQTIGVENTAVGRSALAATADGIWNTAVGSDALAADTFGSFNVAIGHLALTTNTFGNSNVAIGNSALQLNVDAIENIAVGDGALGVKTDGNYNTAFGFMALGALTAGIANVSLGTWSGRNLSSGTNNIYLSNDGAAIESNTIRIGSTGPNWVHNRLFLAGARGVTTGVNNGVPLLIDSNGQVGTVSSSRRTKDRIEDLGPVSSAIHGLRPVQFVYRQPFSDGSTPLQYGLIAEEVEEVLPELVAYGADGQPETVKYHLLPTLLLAEIQRLERERARQHEEIAALRALVERAILKDPASVPRQ